MNAIFKPVVCVLAGMAGAVVENVVPMFVLTGTFVFADTLTALRLQWRLVRAGKLDARKARLSSARFGKVLKTLAKILGLLVLTSMADFLVLAPLGIPAMRIVAGAVCFWQAISLLENEASENDARWAVYARRILIDKAMRYLK